MHLPVNLMLFLLILCSYVCVVVEKNRLKLDIPVSKKVLAYILEPTLRYIARQIETIDS